MVYIMYIILISLTMLLFDIGMRATIAELWSNVLLLLEMIFVRDESFYVTINDAPFCSRHDLVSFISLICSE